MAEVAVKCPHCQSEAVAKYGKTSNGKERFRCQQREQCGQACLIKSKEQNLKGKLKVLRAQGLQVQSKSKDANQWIKE